MCFLNLLLYRAQSLTFKAAVHISIYNRRNAPLPNSPVFVEKNITNKSLLFKILVSLISIALPIVEPMVELWLKLSDGLRADKLNFCS